MNWLLTIVFLLKLQFTGGSSEGLYFADQSEENIEILQNFHLLHRSWFENTNSYVNYEPYGTLDVHENVEGALRYTKVLFGIEEGVGLASVLEGNRSLEGIRSSGEFDPMGELTMPFAGSPNYYFYHFGDDESKRQSKVLMRYYTLSESENDSAKYELKADGETSIVLLLESPLSVDVYNPGDSALWDNITGNISSIVDDSDCNPSSEGFYLQYGKLLGVKEAEDCHLKYVDKRVNDDPWSYDDVENKTMNLFLNPGGGALGGMDYWVNNNTNITNNGQRAVIRHTSNEKFGEAVGETRSV